MAACGGGSATKTSPSGPQLANSPIPTVTPTDATPAWCAPEVALDLPADFPTTDVVVPPDFIVWSVERSPHLRVVGTVFPFEDQQGRAPFTVVSDALIDRLQQARWAISLNDKIEGRDYDFTRRTAAPAHFLAQPRDGCPARSTCNYDINWTPRRRPVPGPGPREPVTAGRTTPSPCQRPLRHGAAV